MDYRCASCQRTSVRLYREMYASVDEASALCGACLCAACRSTTVDWRDGMPAGWTALRLDAVGHPYQHAGGPPDSWDVWMALPGTTFPEGLATGIAVERRRVRAVCASLVRSVTVGKSIVYVWTVPDSDAALARLIDALWAK